MAHDVFAPLSPHKKKYSSGCVMDVSCRRKSVLHRVLLHKIRRPRALITGGVQGLNGILRGALLKSPWAHVAGATVPPLVLVTPRLSFSTLRSLKLAFA